MIFVLYEKNQIHTFMEHLNCALKDRWATFIIYLFLIYLKLNSHMWPMATIVNYTALDYDVIVKI